ncbi:MAG: hypothetical protein AB7I27_14235 [Bacteriovoracaceae bacterium]
MKRLVFVFILLFVESTFAVNESQQLAIVKNIDDFDFPRYSIEISEEALTQDEYLQLLTRSSSLGLTLISQTKARSLFSELTMRSGARMKYPGGRCAQRRLYIQNYLKKLNIISGKLRISCPGNNGNLRLQDQVSGHYYTYSNFHETNVVAVKTNSGTTLKILDLQFQDGPVSLRSYLAEIEAYQRIRPLKRLDPKSGTCYWSVN